MSQVHNFKISMSLLKLNYQVINMVFAETDQSTERGKHKNVNVSCNHKLLISSPPTLGILSTVIFVVYCHVPGQLGSGTKDYFQSLDLQSKKYSRCKISGIRALVSRVIHSPLL